MAYTDDWAKIQAQIKRYSTPSKNYSDESFRRGMLSGWNQLGQQYQAAGHNRGENMDSLRRDVMNTGYSTNNTRGTYSGDAFGAGMSDINYNYRMQLQDIRNGMTDLADQQWAYTHRPRGGGSRRPNYPTPSGVNINAVASSPSIYGQTSSGAPVVGSVIPREAAAAYTGTSLHNTSPASSPDPYEWWKRNH